MNDNINETQETEKSMYENGKKNLKPLVVLLGIFIVFIFLTFTWKLPVYLQFEALKLPENHTVYKPSKVVFSQTYNDKILGEKVIVCPDGCETAKKYIEENNSKFLLKYFYIGPYERMTDDAVYYSEFDFDFLELEDDKKDNYIVLKYHKDIFGMPWHYFSSLFWY